MDDTHPSQTQLRVLVLLNENSPIIPALLFLKKQGYKVKIIHRLMDAIQELSKSNPDVLLISWNLKKTDVRKAYGLLSKKFDSLCIVFGEENSKKTSTAIMSSGILHTLLPPVSGPGIHMRIQSLLRKRRMQAGINDSLDFNDPSEKKPSLKIVTSQSQIREDGKIDTGQPKKITEINDELTKVNTQDIPLTTQWDKLDGNIWKGTTDTAGIKTFYYFEGKDKPTIDIKNKKWKDFGKVSIVTSQTNLDKEIKGRLNKVTAADGYSSSASFFDSELEVLTPKTKNKAEENKSDAKLVSLLESEYEAMTILRPKSEKNMLSKGVQKAVATSIRPDRKKGKKTLSVTSKFSVTQIKTSQFQGYLVGANANDIPDIELMKEVLKHLGTTLQDLGEALNIKTKILELNVDPIPFMIWVDSKAEFFVTSHHGENEVAYAYLPFLNMPEIVEAQSNNDLIGIKLSSIYPGKPVPFNVYIYMPKNKKYLLYLKTGAKAETKILSKLIKFGVKHVYLNRADEESYHTYCAKYKIAEAYEDFKKSS